MNSRQPSQSKGSEHHAVAVRELVSHECDYDTSTSAWAEFDASITAQLAEMEQRLKRYFTPQATRKSLGRA